MLKAIEYYIILPRLAFDVQVLSLSIEERCAALHHDSTSRIEVFPQRLHGYFRYYIINEASPQRVLRVDTPSLSLLTLRFIYPGVCLIQDLNPVTLTAASVIQR